MEEINDVLEEVTEEGISPADPDAPNPFVVDGAAEGPIAANPEPVELTEEPLPPEWNLVAFKHDITNMINRYIQNNSAIFIVDFIEAVAADVKRIANSQADDLINKYNPQ